MNKVGAYICLAVFCILMLAGLINKYYYDRYKVELIKNYYLAAAMVVAILASAILFVFFQWDTVPAGEIIYKEQVGMFIANLPIIIMIFLGALMFLFLIPAFLSSPDAGLHSPGVAIIVARAMGVMGLLLVALFIFGKTELVMMKDGFTLLDSASSLRNKIFKQGAIGYSSLNGYSLEKNMVHLYLKSASLPFVGYSNVVFNFKSKNPGRIVEILKSKGVKDLNNVHE